MLGSLLWFIYSSFHSVVVSHGCRQSLGSQTTENLVFFLVSILGAWWSISGVLILLMRISILNKLYQSSWCSIRDWMHKMEKFMIKINVRMRRKKRKKKGKRNGFADLEVFWIDQFMWSLSAWDRLMVERLRWLDCTRIKSCVRQCSRWHADTSKVMAQDHVKERENWWRLRLYMASGTYGKGGTRYISMENDGARHVFVDMLKWRGGHSRRWRIGS